MTVCLLVRALLLVQVSAATAAKRRHIIERPGDSGLEAANTVTTYYQTPGPHPTKGLPPPHRPDFLPIYRNPAQGPTLGPTPVRLNDKSGHRLRRDVTPELVLPPTVETFFSSEGKVMRDLEPGESRLDYHTPTYTEVTPQRPRGDSAGRKRPPGQTKARQTPNMSARAAVPPSASRREAPVQYEDSYAYDPRPVDPISSPPSSHTYSSPAPSSSHIYPIPIEFINQIPGAGEPFQQGNLRLEPETTSFQSPGHIEQIVKGIPQPVEDSSNPFSLEVELGNQPSHNQSPRSLRSQATPIFREEYPVPSGTPYPPVPYHDTRLDVTPNPVSQPSDRDARTLRYATPSEQANGNYALPPPSPTHRPDSPTQHTARPSQHSTQGSGLKTGYFPPSTRVMPRVSHIEAECRDDFMKLRVAFNDSFSGLIYSAGYTQDNDCMYINGTGQDVYDFYIQLNRCGTLGGSDHSKREVKNTKPTKNYMWNTVTIQYNPLIEEEWDEHFKVTCEYGYDFWKTVTFPFLEVETNTADPVVFTLTPPECFMEIRSGYGVSGPRITGPVHVGDPVTLAINMRSRWDGFDMVVNDCVAHNGANKRIQLIDHHGCPVDEKLIAKFQGSWSESSSMYETVIFAHMKTFRFTGTPALYIECDVRMCHGKCPTQPCDWREGALGHTVRRKRSAEKMTVVEGTILGDREEALGDSEEDILGLSAKQLPGNFSESLNLFQSLQVLANEEEERAFRNETASRVLVDEADFCFSSLMFTSSVAAVTAVLILSGLSISLLCARVRRQDKGGQESTRDVVHTLRSSRSARAEYIHSPQARIP